MYQIPKTVKTLNLPKTILLLLKKSKMILIFVMLMTYLNDQFFIQNKFIYDSRTISNIYGRGRVEVSLATNKRNT